MQRCKAARLCCGIIRLAAALPAREAYEMTTKTALEPQAAIGYAHLEPLPDPPRTYDMQQRIRNYAFHGFLEAHFAHRADVLVCGEGYLRNDPTNDAERLAPDCVVAFGVDSKAIVERNGYVVSEVGKPPDFVLEVASRSTGRRDYTVKRDGYAGYGVGEYWRFDWTGGRYHDAPLAGDRLVGGVYEPLPIHREPSGLIWGHSPVLGLDLCWDEGDLRIYDPVAGEYLRSPGEWRFRAADAESRAAEAEAEARRLREQLRRMEQSE